MSAAEACAAFDGLEKLFTKAGGGGGAAAGVLLYDKKGEQHYDIIRRCIRA